MLALTAERDALRAGHGTAMQLLRAGAGAVPMEHCFAGSHPLMDVARAAEYAQVVADFVSVPS